jgi:hypothetical protein
VCEALASGCLTTAFVWAQHVGAVARTVATPNFELRDRLLPDLCSGKRRAGVAITSLLTAGLKARPSEAGWTFSGTAPWVSGIGLTDCLLTVARTDDGRVVWGFVDWEPLRTTPLRMVACSASGTVEAVFEDVVVPASQVVDVHVYASPPAYEGGGRLNGSLALGVIDRCCRLMGASPFDAELEARHAQLNSATGETMAAGRAAACELAVRASAALMAARGSRAALVTDHAQRLAREATFLLSFGSRPAIREHFARLIAREPDD